MLIQPTAATASNVRNHRWLGIMSRLTCRTNGTNGMLDVRKWNKIVDFTCLRAHLTRPIDAASAAAAAAVLIVIRQKEKISANRDSHEKYETKSESDETSGQSSLTSQSHLSHKKQCDRRHFSKTKWKIIFCWSPKLHIPYAPVFNFFLLYLRQLVEMTCSTSA